MMLITTFYPLWASATIVLLSVGIVGDKNKNPLWLGPQEFSIGTVPASRGYFGFSAVKDKLFVFGGGRGTIGLSLFIAGVNLNALTLTAYMLSEYLNDLYMLDPDSLQWTDLSSSTLGGTPSRRAAPGFTQLNDKLYLFGGGYGYGKGYGHSRSSRHCKTSSSRSLSSSPQTFKTLATCTSSIRLHCSGQTSPAPCVGPCRSQGRRPAPLSPCRACCTCSAAVRP
jgi:hypothetical protein